MGGRKIYSYGYVFNGFAAELTAEQAAEARVHARRALRHEGRVAPLTPRPRLTSSALTLTRLWDGSTVRATRARTSSSASSTAASGRNTQLRQRPHRDHGNDREGRGKLGYRRFRGWNGHAASAGESIHRQRLQPEAHRCPLLQRSLGRRCWNRRRAALGVQLAARLRWPRHPHGSDRRRQSRTSSHGPGRVLRPRQRHRAARDASQPTRSAGRSVDGSTAAASRPTASRQSTRPSPTAWTSSTSRSAAHATNFRDPVEIAFLFAADAGVFVAASAGNSGPTTEHRRASESVDHDRRGRHAQPQLRSSR